MKATYGARNQSKEQVVAVVIDRVESKPPPFKIGKGGGTRAAYFEARSICSAGRKDEARRALLRGAVGPNVVR